MDDVMTQTKQDDVIVTPSNITVPENINLSLNPTPHSKSKKKYVLILFILIFSVYSVFAGISLADVYGKLPFSSIITKQYGNILISNFPFLPKVADNQVIYFGEYCSFANNCPPDKCNSVTHCGGGAQDFGCSVGQKECLYKDNSLKENYKELSWLEAKSCLQIYLKQYKSEFPDLLDISNMSNPEPPNNLTKRCSFTYGGDKTDDQYCWSFLLSSTKDPYPKNENKLDYKLFVEVGAQTCNVYTSSISLEDLKRKLKIL